MQRLVVFLPVAVFAALVGLMISLLTNAERNDDLTRLPSPLVGKPAPEITLPAINATIPGGFSTADLKGQVSLVNVFASWCVPCLVEHPNIARIAELGTPVYGINHRDKPEAADTWLRRHGNPYTAVGADLDARASIEWGVTGVPETFIINANGVVTYKHVGPITQDAMDNKILPKLREAAGG